MKYIYVYRDPLDRLWSGIDIYIAIFGFAKECNSLAVHGTLEQQTLLHQCHCSLGLWLCDSSTRAGDRLCSTGRLLSYLSTCLLAPVKSKAAVRTAQRTTRSNSLTMGHTSHHAAAPRLDPDASARTDEGLSARAGLTVPQRR